VRDVSDGGRPTSEGVRDRAYHRLEYAYAPHQGAAADAQPWIAAYAFNQPLIPVWRLGERIAVQLPFEQMPPRVFAADPAARALPATFSVAAADSGMIADLYRRDGRIEALVIDLDPATPVSIAAGGTQTRLPPAAIARVPVTVAHPPP
jgi:hypothetical protein